MSALPMSTAETAAAAETTRQAANLLSARRLAAARVGWSGIDPSGMSFTLREAYNTELQSIILQYPDRFAPGVVAAARARTPDGELETYGVTAAAADFARELGNQVAETGAAVAGIGEGVKSTLSLTRYLIPVAAVAALVFALAGLRRRLA